MRIQTSTRTTKWSRIIVVAALLVSLPVAAARTNLLLLLPGFPGTSEQAQPYVDKMLRYLEKDLGFEANSMTGVFIPDGDKAKSKLNEIKPGIALVGPSVYAQNAKAMKMKVIAKVTASGRGEARYYVVVKKDFAGSIADLAGTISGTVVYDKQYVVNVLLDRLVASDKIVMKPNKRPLRALRDVSQGNVDAAIIDDDVKNHMAELPMAPEIKIIYTSEPVPAPAVVVLNDGKKHAAAVKKSIANLCEKPDGKELCKSLTISSISPADDTDYKALLKRYNR
ncbi:MAG: PhnD/SsuA/transferrin family substrate-binding protein [Deltaproteobacteria bacterium]|nr:PhnD/SsuA/transferrin family substrate-binding protein [Deltaproteobacteria bacterium]MBN2674594.1 PhnD/SsuA/transferrin family substrate-binding protein [Deltaproteobacteria bacterium]